jgi:hypothetical protein
VTSTNESPKEENLWDRLRKLIYAELLDTASVEVITAEGDTNIIIRPGKDIVEQIAEGDKAKILLRTRIELDGDRLTIIKHQNINAPTLAVHKENVDSAIQNWGAYLTALSNVLQLLRNLIEQKTPLQDEKI